MAKAVVYTIEGCPVCDKLKEDWRSEGVEFEEKRVDESQTFLDEALKYGDSVPIIVHEDGKIEVGYKNIVG